MLATNSKAERAEWESKLRAAISNPPAWQTLKVVRFTSTGGEEATILDDHSVLIGGSLPDTTLYTLTLELPVEIIGGLVAEKLGRDGPLKASAVLLVFCRLSNIHRALHLVCWMCFCRCLLS